MFRPNRHKERRPSLKKKTEIGFPLGSRAQICAAGVGHGSELPKAKVDHFSVQLPSKRVGAWWLVGSASLEKGWSLVVGWFSFPRKGWFGAWWLVGSGWLRKGLSSTLYKKQGPVQIPKAPITKQRIADWLLDSGPSAKANNSYGKPLMFHKAKVERSNPVAIKN